ncbi:MAG: hypothetical protein B6D41_04510 [Chloroflexi bacterium UTCFX4]|jgi:hypothetical protein|nr:MAG: hypothetical protein B6D41_04510 [Chloroflexi bacterium UTCFX4]
MKWFKLFAVFALVVFAASFAPHVAKADGPVIQKKSVESKVPRSGPGTSSVSKQYGNAKVTLTVWLRYYDYGNSEDVSGRVSAATTNVSAANVNYLEAGGTLLKGGYGGTQYPVDTGNIAHVTSVDTGWTAYYHGTNLLWIMSGHSYWDIWVGSYRWIDNVWADNSHQF